MEQQTLNPYYELGVEPGVTPQQLKQAYRQSVMRYHPDTSSGNGNAKKFRQVTEAYQLLQKMNAYQSSHAEKKTVSRASNLRQKFSSVFQKKRQPQTESSKPWWENTSGPQENDKKRVEDMKLKEWEEQFDKDQKMKERREILKDQRLKQRELDQYNLNTDETDINKDFSSKLENFEVDKSSEH